MDEEYTGFEVVVMESGAVEIREPGSCPTTYDSIDEAIKGIERKLLRIRGDMHFETEHDSFEVR